MIDLAKLRERASGLPDSDGAIGPTWCTPVETLELLDYVAQLEEEVKNKDAVQAQRVVLSEEEIFNIYCKSDSELNTTTTNLTLFARAIESAHGITQEKQG